MPALVRALGGVAPRVGEGVFLAETAVVLGDVVLGAGASVWYGAVLRGDVGPISIGEGTNVQDLACVHVTGGVSVTRIGRDCTVGHGVIVHGARIGDGALIGMGAILLDNAEIGEEALIAAGSVVPPRMVVPPRVLVRGSPARVARDLTDEERREGRRGAEAYRALARVHAAPG